jgi:hypothetical protein
MTKIVIYESAMCCSSGVCGPNPDKELIELQDTIEKVQKMGCEVERYSITQSPKKFRENPAIIKLIQEHQIKALPVTTYEGRIVKVGTYPSLGELQGAISENKPIPALTLPVADGCCSGKTHCDIGCGPNYEGDLKKRSNSCC